MMPQNHTVDKVKSFYHSNLSKVQIVSNYKLIVVNSEWLKDAHVFIPIYRDHASFSNSELRIENSYLLISLTRKQN